MKVKVSELTGRALDWMAGVASGYEMGSYGVGSLRARVPGQGVYAPWRPTFYWNQGGPIIERENTSTAKVGRALDDAMAPHPECWCSHIDGEYAYYGPTPLIAAMRCYVASKLGDTVEVPDALLDA